MADDTADLSLLKRAYLALEAAEARCRTLEQARVEPIAVVGIGCRLPGGAATPDAYWHLLSSGGDAVCEVPADRWDADALYDPDPGAPGRVCTRRGGWLREPVDQFDPQFFGISPREAETMDPQQRLLLEVAWEALEDAAQIEERLAGSATGVFIGITSHDYADRMMAAHAIEQVGTHLITGNTHNAAAGRLSYCFGFHGPCLAVDTACSSSLVAVHLACRSLLQGECRRALAGGVNLILSPVASIALSQGRVLAPDGVCRAFDAAASGMVRGEGCAVIVLKRLSDAIADGDAIRAVIRGSATNQDGPSSGLTVPNGPAQAALIRGALDGAGLTPSDIDYIEAHGTGTPLGDPIELRALAEVFGPGRDRPLIVGTVKSNIGHLEACAGVAGLVKIVLALQHGSIPPHLHFQEPTPHLPWETLPFRVPTAPHAWLPGPRPRLAGVSSFGFSGVNAHVLVQEAPEVAPRPVAAHGSRPVQVLPLGARSEAALREAAGRLAAHLARQDGLDGDGLDWADVCFSAGAGRAHGAHRLAVPAHSTREARARLHGFLDGTAAPDVWQGHAATPPRVAFLFTGQGSQFACMGRGLYASEPAFRRVLDRCEAILRPELDRPLLDVLFADATHDHAIDDTGYAQPALFAIECGLAELWQSWGVQPTLVLGHSVGELAAACVAGVFSLEDGLRLTATRGRLMQALPRAGAMLAVAAGAELVAAAVRPHAALVSVAAYNAPGETVVSGRRDAVEAIAEELAAAGVRARPLRVSHAFHSPLMDPMLDAFEAEAAKCRMTAPRIGLISNLAGGPAAAEIATASYWRRHVRQPVRFADGIAAARRQDCSVFLEIGPRPALLAFGRQTLPGETIGWLPSLRPAVPDGEAMQQSLAELYALGARIDWHGVHREVPRRRVALPTTPFQRQRCWLDLPPRQPQRPMGTSRGFHPLLGTAIDLAGSRERRFEANITGATPAFLQDHKVFGATMLPAAAFLDLVMVAGRTAAGTDALVLEDVTFQRPLVLAEAGARTVQTVLQPGDTDDFGFAIYSRDPAAGDKAWTRHVAGRLRRSEALPIPPKEDVVGLIASAGAERDVAALYGRCRARGIDLGPRFQALRRVWSRETAALGELCLEEIAGDGEVGNAANAYALHPVLLDAAFQAMTAVFADHDGGDVYLPVSLDRIMLHRRPGAAGWSRVRVEPILGAARRSMRVDLVLLCADGEVAAVLEGLHFAQASREQVTAAPSEVADWLYAVEWREQPAPAQANLPSAELIGGEILPGLRAAFREPPELARFGAFLEAIEDLALDYIVGALQALGWAPEPGAPTSTAALAARLGIAERHRRLFARLLGILAEAAIVRETAAAIWDIDGRSSRRAAPERVDAALQLYPEAAPELVMLQRCGDRLADVLRGECDPLGLLFPQDDAVSAAALYGDTPGARATNGFLARLVAAMVAQVADDRRVRVLEIGAGTGATTGQLVPLLRSRCVEYTFTDISPLFVHQAAERFSDQPFVRCRVLDIEAPPTAQGYPAQSCDIVIAANVLHATRDVGLALRHARELLVPGGLLVLLEGTARLRFIDLIFGLTDGWWRFADTDLRPDHPLLSPEAWQTQLDACGFHHAGTVAASRTAGGLWSTQALITAVRSERAPRRSDGQSDRWLIFSPPRSPIADALRERIRCVGGEATLVRPGPRYERLVDDTVQLDPTDRTQFDWVFDTEGPLAGIVDLWPSDVAGDDPETWENLGWGAALHLVQAVVAKGGSPIPLWLVTRGAQPAGAVPVSQPGVAQSPLLGLGKVAALEHPELRCVCVDLDAEDDVAAARDLCEEILRPVGEDQVALRAGRRYVARLVRKPPPVSGQTVGAVRPDATYLITGGLRGLGLATAAWLVERGARSLVLLGRSAPDAAAMAALADMRGAGAVVAAVEGDVADAGRMAALLAQIEADLPPLRGVIHAAGVLDDGILAHQTAARFRCVLAPKLLGAWHLHRLTADRPLDFFVLYSSLASLMGSAGQANHAAANAFLDALAHHRRGAGLPGLSINWGVWSDIGAAVRRQVGERAAMQGMGMIAPHQGLRILGDLLFGPAAQVGVMPLYWAVFATHNAARRHPALFTDLIDATPEGSVRPAAPPTNLAPALHAAPPAERQALLEAHLHAQVARVLRLAPDAVDPCQPLTRMGLDSLMAVELRNSLRAQLGIDVPLVHILDEASIAALAAQIGPRIGTDGEPGQETDRQDAESSATADDEQSLLARIDQLTDAEVDALLDAALAGEAS